MKKKPAPKVSPQPPAPRDHNQPPELDAADFEAAPAPTGDKLEAIRQMSVDMIAAKKDMDRLVIELKKAADSFNSFYTDRLPKALDDIGMVEFTMVDGSSIKVEATYICAITKANQPDAFKWLRDNKHGGIIKRKVQVEFGMGDDKHATKLLAYILGHKIFKDRKLTDAIGVHAGTLKAWVKEQFKLKAEIPPSISVLPLRRAVLKSPAGVILTPVKQPDKDDEL